MRPRLLISLAGCLVLAACSSDDAPAADAAPGDAGAAVVSAAVSGKPRPLKYFGDLWPSTWADDGRLYLSWGDGTGIEGCVPTFNGTSPGAWSAWDPVNQVSPNCFNVSAACPMCGVRVEFCRTFDCGKCYPLCPYTDTGLLALSGSAPGFDACKLESCLVQRNIPRPKQPPLNPDGSRADQDDKSSSLLYLDQRLYMAGHSPAGSPTQGYLAWSADRGKSWQVVKGSPWTGKSHFRVLMLINMGQAYGLNTDGFVYGLGLDVELDLARAHPVYLARVKRAQIATYASYEYFTGSSGGAPRWSSDQRQAAALPGLSSHCQGSAMYHPGTGRYLFLSGVSSTAKQSGALFEAPRPWGPWTKVGHIPGLAISSLIPRDTGARDLYFTHAGGTSSYNLNVSKIVLTVAR